MSLEEAQIQLQNALTTTFLANLVFLSEYDNELYQKVEALSQLIQEGKYEERYVLDFIEKDGDFDIYDQKNKVYLYDKNPKKINNALVKRVEFDDKNTIKTVEEAFLRQYTKFYDKEYLKEEISDYAGQFLLYDINAYNKVLHNKRKDEKIRYKKMEKFVFFGTLLGRHIPRIAQKMNSYVYMVFEKNLEIFRLSLFTVDYTILAKRGGVVFSIMDDDYESKISKFLEHDFMNNCIIKFSSTYNNTKEYTSDFLYKVLANRSTTFDYNRILYNVFKKNSLQWNNKYPKLVLKDIKNHFDYFEDKPVLFVAAGPSLGDNLAWIKENQNKFIIATVGAAYKTLLKNNIKIDFIFTLDASYKVLKEKQFSNEDVALLSDEIIFASTITDQRILDSFNNKQVFLYETMKCFHIDNFDIPAFSIGELAMGLLINMNVKELYLIGLDMALNQKTGDSHSISGTSSSVKHNLDDEDKIIGNTQYVGLKSGLTKVKGNIDDEVYTTGVFKNSIYMISIILDNLAEDIKIYNISNHGAYFKNTIPLKIEDINIEKLNNIVFNKEDFKTNLTKYSNIYLQGESREKISDEIKYLEKFIKNDFEDFLKDDSNNFETFMKANMDFFENLMRYNTYKHTIIFANYFDITLNHLSFYFNRRKIKDEDKKIKQVRTIMQEKLKELLEDSISYLTKSIR